MNGCPLGSCRSLVCGYFRQRARREQAAQLLQLDWADRLVSLVKTVLPVEPDTDEEPDTAEKPGRAVLPAMGAPPAGAGAFRSRRIARSAKSTATATNSRTRKVAKFIAGSRLNTNN